MLTWLATARSLRCKFIKFGAPAALLTLLGAASALADEAGGEASLKLPDLSQVSFLGIDGHKLLLFGIVICIFGLGFGLAIYSRLKNLPVHKSMRDISELIYETCKTYLFTQGKFLLILWVFIAVVIVMYFGWLAPVRPVAVTLPIILIFSLVGIAGRFFMKNADIGSDLMKIVVKIKEDDARNPGVIADCTGDDAGDSVGPSADGFETYGVTGVALITFILLAVKNPTVQVQLLVWIFVMRIVMLIASAAAYFINGFIASAKYGKADHMNYEAPLTSLVWITSVVSIALTYVVSSVIIPSLGGDTSQWWKLATIISCGTLAGAIIPELVKVFTSTESRHVKEVVTSAEEGGASLGILSSFVAGNFSAYYIVLAMVLFMSIGYLITGVPN